MNDMNRLEQVAKELLDTFDVKTPPIPIESMLAYPKDGMWEEVDITQLSGTFLSLSDRFTPRMSFARLLARQVATCPWGKDRGILNIFKQNEELIHTFARMIIMPADMVTALSSGALNPTAMSMKFEVPEDDARLRLKDLSGQL
jgi:hypothetical protein